MWDKGIDEYIDPCNVSLWEPNVGTNNPERYNLPFDYIFSENSWGNSFYKIYNTKMNYADAKAKCESDGTFLAYPRSETESDFIGGLITDEQWMWIGINDIENEGLFVGADGREISWTDWANGEPDGIYFSEGVEMATGVEMTGLTGNWRDRSINELRPFVCSLNIEGKIISS